MIILFSIILFSKSDCLLVLCYIYLHVPRASTRRMQDLPPMIRVFLLQCERPSFTPTQHNGVNYSSVYLNLWAGIGQSI